MRSLLHVDWLYFFVSAETLNIHYHIQIELRTFGLHIKPSKPVASVLCTALHFCSVYGPQKYLSCVELYTVSFTLCIFSICAEQRDYDEVEP